MNSRTHEIIRFVVTGIICFFVEFIILVLLKGVFQIDTLIATPIAFLVSVSVNYLICLKWVFQGVKENDKKTKAAFLITSIIGLVLNEILMYVFRIVFGEEKTLFVIFGFTVNMYMINKVLATLLVMVWNYVSKRRVLIKQ